MRAPDLLVVLLRALGLLLMLHLFEFWSSLLAWMCYWEMANSSAGNGLDLWWGISTSSMALLWLIGAGLLVLFAGRIGARLNHRPAGPASAGQFAGIRIDVLAAMIRLLGLYGLFRTTQPLDEVVERIILGFEGFETATLIGSAFQIVVVAVLSFLYLFRAGQIAAWLETQPWDTVTSPDDDESVREPEETAGAAG